MEITTIDDETLNNIDDQAALFAAEYAQKLGKVAPTIKIGKATEVGANDIALVYDESLNMAEQSFKIVVDGSSVEVRASDMDGLFYGWREVLKQLLANGRVSDTTDAPDVLERSVSLDNGRKYFSVDDIKELIREMSWNNMNTLVLHFSEEMGLGLESKLYPWLNGRDGTLCVGQDLGENYDSRYLTQAELVEIAAYADTYHIELVPSLDTPGHMNHIVKSFNEQAKMSKGISFDYNGHSYKAIHNGSTYVFYKDGTKIGASIYGIGSYYSYNGKTAIVQGSRNLAYSRGIDISNELAVAFTQSLLMEYATLFRELGSTKIDLGGDELLGWGKAVTDSVNKWKQLDHWKAYAQERTGKSYAVAYDAFLLYMNDLYDLVTAEGYEDVRVWNDNVLRSTSATGWSGAATLNKNIDVWYWTAGGKAASDYIGEGYSLYNIEEAYCYYAMNSGYYAGTTYPKAKAQSIYETWNPYYMGGATLASGLRSNVLGGAFGIWCDDPSLRTSAEVIDEVVPILRSNAAKSWNAWANSTKSYSQFATYLTAIGNAPVVDMDSIGGVIPDTTRLRELIDHAYELAADQEANATYVQSSFDNYMYVVREADFYYTGVNLCYYSQEGVDAMCDVILASEKNLYSVDISAPLQELLLEYALVYVPDHAENPYSLESWALLTLAVQDAAEMLAEGNYTTEDVDKCIKEIKDMIEHDPTIIGDPYLRRESEVAPYRVNCGIVGNFQLSYIYSGKETARITITIPRSVPVNSSTIMVFREDGTPVATKITELPYNFRTPTVRRFYLDVDTTGLSSGEYVFDVRIPMVTVDGNGRFTLLYSKDAAECKLTVK